MIVRAHRLARLARLGLVASLALGVGLGAGACGKKDEPAKKVPAARIAGLAAVPASVQVVLSADVPALLDAPLVTRAIGQLLARDADLATRWDALRASCHLELGTNIQRLLVAVGAPAAGQRPALLVATGKLVEADLATCVRAMVGAGGGTLTASDHGGRTTYKAQDRGRTVFFTFGQEDTVIFSASETLLEEAIGPGPRFANAAPLQASLAKVDLKAPLWGLGVMDERVGQGLIKATAGAIKQGPAHVRVALDPHDGLAGSLVIGMATEADATALETFVTAQLSVMAMAAQVASLGPVVAKVKVSRAGSEVTLAAALTTADLNHVLSAIDSMGAGKQDAVPSAPAAVSPP